MSLAVGDAAALGHLFQHLHSHEQIESFLWAFEEIRQNRVKSVREAELNYLSTITLPSGEMQESRDKSMRAKYDAGLNALDVEDGDIIQQFEVSYDLSVCSHGYESGYSAPFTLGRTGNVRIRRGGRGR